MEPKIAFVQDVLPYWGGAERLLTAALEVYPEAPVYTLIYNQEAFQGTSLAQRKIWVSPLDRLPGAHRYHKAYLPLMPLAVETLDLKEYDIVVSFSYAVAHAAHTHPGQLHISYIHTPMRYAWRGESMLHALPGFARLPVYALKPLLFLFRIWDKAMLRRTNVFVTNSHWMADMIQKTFERPASVLYPPVDAGRFLKKLPRTDDYIYVGRLAAYKRVDILIDAFSQLQLPLLIIGKGPDESRLRAYALSLGASNIQFLGWQTEEQVSCYLSQARAFVHAGEEDFGIAAAEAQAAGCPVIALRKSGAAEIVSHQKTGLLFDEQNSVSLCSAVLEFEQQGVEYSSQEIQSRARCFDRSCFQHGFKALIETSWDAFSNQGAALQHGSSPAARLAEPERVYGCGA